MQAAGWTPPGTFEEKPREAFLSYGAASNGRGAKHFTGRSSARPKSAIRYHNVLGLPE
jgi:hypothetical protein